MAVSVRRIPAPWAARVWAVIVRWRRWIWIIFGLAGLRTLQAMPGTLADPLEIAGLTRLEFLALGPEGWRVLLDAGAVPRTLSAAAVDSHDGRNPLPLVAISNELLALWGRLQITQNVLEGDLLQEWPSA